VGLGFCVGFVGKRRARSAFFLWDAFGVLLDGLVRASRLRPDPRLGRGWNAVVLLKSVLSGAVECQRGDGALQACSDQAPRAVRATPAGKVLVFGPDHVSIHSYTHSCISMYGVPTGGEGRTTRHWRTGARKLNQCPRRRECATESWEVKVTNVLRPVGQWPSGRGHWGARSCAVRSPVFREFKSRIFHEEWVADFAWV
jgi:hypothetical protein